MTFPANVPDQETYLNVDINLTSFEAISYYAGQTFAVGDVIATYTLPSGSVSAEVDTDGLYEIGQGTDSGNILLTQAGLDYYTSEGHLSSVTIVPYTDTEVGLSIEEWPKLSQVPLGTWYTGITTARTRNEAIYFTSFVVNDYYLTDVLSVGDTIATFEVNDYGGAETPTVALGDTNVYELGTGEDYGKVLLTQAGADYHAANTALTEIAIVPYTSTEIGVVARETPFTEAEVYTAAAAAAHPETNGLHFLDYRNDKDFELESRIVEDDDLFTIHTRTVTVVAPSDNVIRNLEDLYYEAHIDATYNVTGQGFETTIRKYPFVVLSLPHMKRKFKHLLDLVRSASGLDLNSVQIPGEFQLPCNGQIDASQINGELGHNPSRTFSLDQSDGRALAEKPSGMISYSDFRCKDNTPVPPPAQALKPQKNVTAVFYDSTYLGSISNQVNGPNTNKPEQPYAYVYSASQFNAIATCTYHKATTNGNFSAIQWPDSQNAGSAASSMSIGGVMLKPGSNDKSVHPGCGFTEPGDPPQSGGLHNSIGKGIINIPLSMDGDRNIPFVPSEGYIKVTEVNTTYTQACDAQSGNGCATFLVSQVHGHPSTGGNHVEEHSISFNTGTTHRWTTSMEGTRHMGFAFGKGVNPVATVSTNGSGMRVTSTVWICGTE